ncbi:L-ascorbate oxidase [Seminavis robusta]|uniref:L-ascorbate oxidase n=1 Tax=Seminavis robusta TaxID=568900 RepID=A0A9N8DS97_9STRA|nr:L-ascorbate oxidase [Seminavis robusta]|eukprot:Sro315_g115410.1 L-ascorbate oxidase (910) ;mRNA; f:68758-71781
MNLGLWHICAIVVLAEWTGTSMFTSAALVARQFTIRPRRSRPPLSPDCFIDKDMLLVDDQNPGPTIRANKGDTIQIKWNNESPSEGVSIHFHGLIMKDQPYADGTGTVSTCVVGPMQTFYQTFVADNAGTHYWHGHTSLDRMDGLQGAIIIDDPEDPEEQALQGLYDGERVIFLQDWYHRSGPGIRTGLDSEPFIWLGDAQSFLINGGGRYGGCLSDPSNPLCDPDGCSVKNYLASVQVEAGKTYLFRVINAAALVAVNFAIAGHSMTIVRVEGTYVDPLPVESLDVNVAQRYDVLVTMDQPPDTSYWISTVVRHRGGVQGHAYLQYDNAEPPNDEDPLPVHFEQDDMVEGPLLDALLVSKNVASLPNSDILALEATRSIVFVGTQTRYAPDNLLRWASNNVSNAFSATPLLTMAYEAVNAEGALPWPDTEIDSTLVVPDSPPLTWHYTNTLQDEGVSIYHDQHGVAIFKFVLGNVVDIVLQNARALNGAAELHAWHLHGHAMWVIGQGMGSFDPENDPQFFNLENPLLRDTISVWPLGWTAVRFLADNVGAWPFHCAMAPHAVMGMGFNVITSPHAHVCQINREEIEDSAPPEPELPASDGLPAEPTEPATASPADIDTEPPEPDPPTTVPDPDIEIEPIPDGILGLDTTTIPLAVAEETPEPTALADIDTESPEPDPQTMVPEPDIDIEPMPDETMGLDITTIPAIVAEETVLPTEEDQTEVPTMVEPETETPATDLPTMPEIALPMLELQPVTELPEVNMETEEAAQATLPILVLKTDEPEPPAQPETELPILTLKTEVPLEDDDDVTTEDLPIVDIETEFPLESDAVTEMPEEEAAIFDVGGMPNMTLLEDDLTMDPNSTFAANETETETDRAIEESSSKHGRSNMWLLGFTTSLIVCGAVHFAV